MKKIVLISTFCDTEEKITVLKENLLTLKKIGLDTLVISPVILPQEIIEISDFVFFTKENPILRWPERGFTFWKTHYSVDGWMTMHHNVSEYGWAGLYQIKKMSQIALTYDYDIFYHIIYDLEIDNYIIDTIKSNEINLVHPRVNPNNSDDLWETTLHFMVFDRDIMKKIVDTIVLEDYLKEDGIAEGQALKCTKLFPIRISKTPVRDKIFYWEGQGFFNYSKNLNYKLFLNKADQTDIWITDQDGKHLSSVDSRFRVYIYDLKEEQNFSFEIDGMIRDIKISQNKIVEFDIESTTIKNFKIIDNQGVFDYSKVYKEIDRNIIYLGT
jgi:hypothetical protein